MTTDKPNYEQEREIGRLIASANLSRMRGQWTEAEDTCRQALGLSPDDPTLREMLGDILREIGKLDLALDEYKAAMALAPGKPVPETKYAKLTIEIAERARERALAEDMIVNPRKYTTRERKPVMALLAAAVVPGLGQLYNGEIVKACIIFGAFLLFPIGYALFPVHPRNPSDMAGLLRGMDPFVQVLAIIAGMAYLYGMIDAPLRAERSSKSGKEKRLVEPE